MSPDEFLLMQDVLWAIFGPFVQVGLALLIAFGLGVAMADMAVGFLNGIQR